jgi:diguanylate cyclase (GGDEF)-like protein
MQRLGTLAVLRKQLQARELELKQLQAELAIVDGSSGAPALASRGMFDRKFRTEWQRAYRARAMLSLVLFEVDGFDSLLALYGEQVGERCMNSIAAMIHDQFQRPSDLVARFGAGVVAVIAAGTEQASALQLAENVRRRVESAGLEMQGLRRGLSVSAGIASLVPDKRHHEAVLLSFADDALYQARSVGGNRCICYRLPASAVQREGN